ncbi:fibronectin type III domain-containing protein [Flavobacterium sp. GSP14]|uniref:fibronectin type III domain-containing protein n=1 Tax=Flavobacterium sp. GSP14 TaxID=3401734 RepID=UPI003AAA7EF1
MMMLTLNTFRNKMGKKNYISRTENKPCIDNQYTNKMLKKHTYFFIFLLLLVGITGFSQTFPVSISTQINQPSPIYWSNYADATTSNSPIKMQIVLNDLTIANRQVRIKCYWQGNGISFMNNDFVVGAQPLFLEGGVPLQLTNINLAPYFEFQNIMGITPNQYAQAMPEGIYTFAVEVYDVATGQKLSRKSTVTAIIFQNESPLLNLPLNQVSIIQQNIQNILFSWTPRQINVSNVEYQFDLIEIWDQYTPVQNAFAYSKPIYTTTTRATTLQYGVAEPQLITGKRYAWRIKAKALVGAEEIGVFKNNGYSEIFAFTYEVYCTPPLLISTEGVSQDQAKITWSGALDNFDYQVNYREKNADSQWYPLETPREYATLANLKPNTAYEYTVGASCEKGKYIHSSIQEFTTLAQDEIALVTCGIVPDPVDLSNLSPLDNLVPNDVIKAGDFPIVVIEATGGNGRFSGEGYVTLPLLERYRKLIDAADNLGEIPKKAAGIVTDAATVATALANHGATQVNNVVTKVEDITGQTINDPTKAVTDQIKSTAALVSDKANALAGMVPDYSTNIGQYTRVAVSFSDIGVNTDFKLISGSIIASYDPEWKSMIDLDPAFNEVFGDAGNVVNYEIDFIIETVIKNQDGTITITSTTGVVTVLDKTVNDIVITDKDGTQYTIPANAPAGPIKPSGQLAPGGVPTAANTNGMGAGGVVKQISSTDVSVVFTKGDGKYAFDTAPTTQNGKLSKSYKSIPQKSGGTYSIPFKAISNRPDSTDVIIATVDFKNGKTKDDIVFKTKNGTLIKSTWNENTAILKLKRTLDYAKETVIAAVRPAPAVQQNPTGSAQPAVTTPIKPTDSKNSPKYDIAGTFNLWHLTHKKVNVTLVSVNGAEIPEDAARTLNQIYEPTGITFNVDTIHVSLNHFWDNTIETGNSDLLNTYTAEQQAITVALKTKLGAEYTADTYYMLYTNEKASNEYAGFMPLKRQFGFVFDGRNKTLAHELGHGVFGLQHPFKQYGTSKGSTDLLMDYGDGTTLNHNDWEIMHAPGLQLYQFTQGSSAGALAGGYGLTPNFEFVSAELSNIVVPKVNLVSEGMLSGFKDNGGNDWVWNKDQNKYTFLGANTSSSSGQYDLIPKKKLDDKDIVWLIYKYSEDCSKIKFIKTKYEKIKEIISLSDKVEAQKQLDAYLKIIDSISKESDPNIYSGFLGCGTSSNNGLTDTNSDGKIVFIRDCNKAQDGTIAYNQKPVVSWNNGATWGEIIVKNLNRAIKINAVNKDVTDLKTVKVGGLQYINPTPNYRGIPIFESQYIDELNNKLAYLEVSSKVQLYINFIETNCSFTDKEGLEFAKAIFDNSQISKTKGIYSLTVRNRDAIGNQYGWKTYFVFGTNISESIKKTAFDYLSITTGQNYNDYGKSIISFYQKIPKKQLQYIYVIEKVTAEEIKNAPTKSFLEKNILRKIVTVEGQIGNAIQAIFSFKDTQTNTTVSLNEKEDINRLKEQYVADESLNLAKRYADQYADWRLSYFDIDKPEYEDGIVSLIPHISECKFTLNKTCIEQYIDDAFLVAGIASIPFGNVAIITVDGLAVVYYASIGQSDMALMYVGLYALGPVLSPIIVKIAKVGQRVTTFGEKLYLANRFSKLVNETALTDAKVLEFLNKPVSLTNHEFLILDPKFGNGFIKVEENQILAGYVKVVNNSNEFYIFELKSGNHVLSSKYRNPTAEELENAFKELRLQGAGNSLFGRSIVNGINGFSDNVASVLSQRGLSLNDFKLLQQKRYDLMTIAEKAHIDAIRNSIPIPDGNTLLQKVIPKNQIQSFIDVPNDNFRKIGGFVSTAKDAKHLNTFEDVYQGMRLDYPGTQFNLSDGSFGVIRYKTPNPNLTVPKLPEVTGDLPYTGNGFTGGNNGKLGAPEWKSPYNTPNEGSELWEVFSDGTEVLKAKFSTAQNKFIPVP